MFSYTKHVYTVQSCTIMLDAPARTHHGTQLQYSKVIRAIAPAAAQARRAINFYLNENFNISQLIPLQIVRAACPPPNLSKRSLPPASLPEDAYDSQHLSLDAVTLRDPPVSMEPQAANSQVSGSCARAPVCIGLHSCAQRDRLAFSLCVSLSVHCF